MSDMVKDLMKLVAPNPSFDQILWDEQNYVLSFRRAGIGDFVNMYLNSDIGDFEHHVERNGGSPAGSVVLWTDGEFVDGKFVWNMPSYRTGEEDESAREGDGPAAGAS